MMKHVMLMGKSPEEQADILADVVRGEALRLLRQKGVTGLAITVSFECSENAVRISSTIDKFAEEGAK